jgi:hypothetical protein
MLFVTDFVNLKIKPTQSFKCVHKNKVCAFIEMSNYMCMNMHIYTVFLIKKAWSLCGHQQKRWVGWDRSCQRTTTRFEPHGKQPRCVALLVELNEPKQRCAWREWTRESRKGAQHRQVARRAQHSSEEKQGRHRKRSCEAGVSAVTPLLSVASPVPPASSPRPPPPHSSCPARQPLFRSVRSRRRRGLPEGRAPPMHPKLSRAARRLLCCGGAAAGEDP